MCHFPIFVYFKNDFAKLYTIHAYFSPRKFDPQNPDKVWVKRMISYVWSFMKRSRTKENVKLLETLIKEALERYERRIFLRDGKIIHAVYINRTFRMHTFLPKKIL